MAKRPTASKGAGDNRQPNSAATKFYANFDGDEVNGRRYALGEALADDVDPGTAAYLVSNGRFTASTAEASDATATGGKGPALTPTPDPLEGVTLTDDEIAARDRLVADEDGNLDKLREIATNEGVEGVTTEQDAATVATLIVVHRRA